MTPTLRPDRLPALPAELLGFKLRAFPQLTVAASPIWVRRTWRERLLTLPWRPHQADKQVPQRRPDPTIYRIEDVLYGHPEALADLCRTYEMLSSMPGAPRVRGVSICRERTVNLAKPFV